MFGLLTIIGGLSNIYLVCSQKMYPETHILAKNHTQINGRDITFHTVDQFGYYQSGMEPVAKIRQKNGGDTEAEILYSNAIRFELPESRLWSPFGIHPAVIVIGDGMGKLDIYAELVYPARLLTEGEIPEGYPLWHLFSSKGFEKGHLRFEAISDPSRILKTVGVFTTYITPFLNGDGYPPYGLRVYHLQSGAGASCLEITSDIQYDLQQDKLQVVYREDDRDWQPYKVTTLRRSSGVWYFENPPQKPQRAKQVS